MLATLVVALCALPAKLPTPAFRPEHVIDYAKRIDVSKLDSKLRSRPLAAWIDETFVPTRKVLWSVGNCDLHAEEPPPAEGYPLCVDFVFDVGHVKVWATVVVGRYERGVTGPPRFDGASVRAPGLGFESCSDLSELPDLVARTAKRAGDAPTRSPRLMVGLPPAGSPTPAFQSERVIDYAKRIDVSRLDPKLPSAGLAAWISGNFSLTGTVRWRTGDCDLKEPPSAKGYPLCVDFTFYVGRVQAWGTIIVGLYRRGVGGMPEFEGAHVVSPGFRFESCQDLGALPALVARLAKQAGSAAPTPRQSRPAPERESEQ